MANFSTLQIGSAGPTVELLQLALTRAGFSPGDIDGKFGIKTFTSLKNFQSSNNLISDGIAGVKTWQALMPWLVGYVSHTIRSGDTLYKLAQRYSSSIRSIETANPDIDPFNLTIGSHIIIPLAFEVVPTNISFTPTVLELCVDGLTARYPFIVSGSAGTSVMGRTIYYLKIGTGANEVFYNASHHANEWITSPLLMHFLEEYASSYSTGGTIWGRDARELYSLSSLFLIPMVNPDGVSLVTGELTSGEYYNNAAVIASDYPSIPFPLGWKANISGVDPNLQYPAGWETAREIKFAQGFTTPAPRDYVGAAPLEIPESRAVYNFTIAHNFSITLSYHTQGRVIYWKYLDYIPENSYDIALLFAAVSGYSVETTPTQSGYAGYKDWFISTYNLPGYTIEVGIGTSPLPLEQFDGIYEENIGILTLGLSVTA